MSLQKYQWGMSGMRPDDSEFGAMHFYRGADVEQHIRDLESRIQFLVDTWPGDGGFTFPDGILWEKTKGT